MVTADLAAFSVTPFTTKYLAITSTGFAGLGGAELVGVRLRRWIGFGCGLFRRFYRVGGPAGGGQVGHGGGPFGRLD